MIDMTLAIAFSRLKDRITYAKSAEPSPYQMVHTHVLVANVISNQHVHLLALRRCPVGRKRTDHVVAADVPVLAGADEPVQALQPERKICKAPLPTEHRLRERNAHLRCTP